jgi:hypothetical protein
VKKVTPRHGGNREPRGLRKLFDLDHPFFRPLWRRVAVVVVCLAWACVEFIGGTPFWGMLFGAIGIYCAWHFFVEARPEEGAEEDR